MEIREVDTDAARREAFPVLRELRDHLDRERFEELYAEMEAEGYRLFARYDGDDPVAVAGVKISTNFYLGRHAYVYDLVTTADRRSEGHGEALLRFVHEWARDRGCDAVELESGLWRDDAHRFYTERMGYDTYCYSFKYDLD
ncbi:GNAT family N-acetyltransferase [Halegenticoccus soli]|uniref:GNAT family N-acetyltransferase n=1 Tax=Halegenticoccus soli TaxID=1985678 RepID=UPI000C6E0910|nr:GNAT family N-acetyltransferase [Halegenticoccus soli]